MALVLIMNQPEIKTKISTPTIPKDSITYLVITWIGEFAKSIVVGRVSDSILAWMIKIINIANMRRSSILESLFGGVITFFGQDSFPFLRAQN